MKKITLVITILFSALSLFAGSSPAPKPDPIPQPVNALFDNYVSVGDSLTHGMQSGAVDETRQKYSYGNRLAQLMKTPYIQALLKFPGYYINFEDVGKGNISWYEYVIPLMGGKRKDGYDNQNKLNNFGISGADVTDINEADGDKDGFHDLVLGGGKTQIDQALDRNPSFMSIWIGNNDALGCAISTTLDKLTSLANFQSQYARLVNKIQARGSIDGALLATIPDVSSIAYLQPANDPDVPQGSLKAFWNSSVSDNDEVLDPNEVKIIKNRTSQFNDTIKHHAYANNWVLFDANSVFEDIKTYGYNLKNSSGNRTGRVLNVSYLGGVFSLDGIHLTTTAYAVIANMMAQDINSHYNTNLGRHDEYKVNNNDDSLYNRPYDPRGLINSWLGRGVQFFVELFM